MDIRIAGHQVDTGQAFRTHVEERLNAIAGTYFKRVIGATITLSNAPHNAFQCDIVMHVMQGLVLKGSNRAAVANVAFDGAADKIEKQLRRYMRRLKDRHPQSAAAEAARDPEQGFNGTNGNALSFDNAAYTVFASYDEEEEPADAPVIIAETRVDIPEASVSDAVMMLDLRNTTALLFRNSGTGALNMVYRREDGNIGWVEPRA